MFTIGADPEIFAVKGKHNLTSVIGKLGGSKWEPRKVGDGFFILEDNVAAEYNIPPCYTKSQFLYNVLLGKKYVENELKMYGLSLSRLASYVFPDTELQDPAAQAFGCEPDFDAWKSTDKELHVNPKPKAANANLRSCGGHIHIGHSFSPVAVIRAMDLFVGVPSVLEDADKNRRQLYGKAGAFRPKDYGCEYRTLSNYWIMSPDTITAIYDRTKKAVEFVEKGYQIPKSLEEAIQEAINNSDRYLVKEINNHVKKHYAF